jgi:hypothetical protein
MKSNRRATPKKPTAGSRVVASVREAVDRAEGWDLPVRVTAVAVPTVDVGAVRKGWA